MFLHAVGFGIVTAAVMALAAVGFTAQSGVTATQLTLVAIAAVGLAALYGLLRCTRLGQAMRATASDPGLWSGAADPATWRGRSPRAPGGLA